MENRSTTILIALIATTAALAGCFDAAPVDEASTEPSGDAATPADAATPDATKARTQGPTAPKEAFSVADGDAATTIHPYAVPGQTARPAEHLVFEGAYDPQDCTTPGVSWMIADPFQYHEFTDQLQAGDAVMGSFTLTFTNTETQWADLHLVVSVPGQFQYHEETSAFERGEQVQTLEFQFAFPGVKDNRAYVGVRCYFAGNTEPIPYKLEAHLAFAEGVVPAGNPHLVRVSENVKELRVSGAPLAEGDTVTGHYRLFGPDDRLVGEYALNSDEAFTATPVELPGEYVIIVDHSEGGMLALGADAPPADPALVVLDSDWALHVDYTQEEPGPVHTTITMDIPRVPLYIFPFVRASMDAPSAMKDVVLDLDGPLGRVWHVAMPGMIGVRTNGLWINQGVPGEGWAFEYDHHALAVGEHQLSVSAETFSGEVFHYYVTYLRPGETGAPAPAASGSDAEGDADARLPVGIA